jgi:hypothetical protein
MRKMNTEVFKWILIAALSVALALFIVLWQGERSGRQMAELRVQMLLTTPDALASAIDQIEVRMEKSRQLVRDAAAVVESVKDIPAQIITREKHHYHEIFRINELAPADLHSEYYVCLLRADSLDRAGYYASPRNNAR